MSDRVKEWDQYFSIHCELPAAAIRDLFDEIERLQSLLEAKDDRIVAQSSTNRRYRAALERIEVRGLEIISEHVGGSDASYVAQELTAIAREELRNE